MSPELLYFLLGIAGTVILILFAILGYFLKTYHADTKKAMEEVGKNKGRIELLEKQLENDIKRIEEVTQLEIRGLATNVADLASQVKRLVEIQMEARIKS